MITGLSTSWEGTRGQRYALSWIKAMLISLFEVLYCRPSVKVGAHKHFIHASDIQKVTRALPSKEV